MKSVWVKVRATDAERDEWSAKASASGTSLSELIRISLTRVRTWTSPDREVQKNLVAELARIGNNLNQIARWANTYKSTASAIEILVALASIERELRGLRRFKK